eukprot:CAMPEP_0119332918 /NCGR_PEP_ID=MMETSP1333-20130426/83878_1 /TAXON_ID=418940 /ORGANISM="Scyphosphaera apsteinii, Strain RCC1455" /LENGTH=200 /DNA_ID=CAMNT_0007342837 /DNA_START=143 /DNA_END=746 /DNA_ORIENTATION=-
MNDMQKLIYGKKEEVAKKLPFASIAEMVAEAGSELDYIPALLGAAHEHGTNLAVLADLMSDDRVSFLQFLQDAGVEKLAHRQKFTNILGKGLREERIVITGEGTRGWGASKKSEGCCPTGESLIATVPDRCGYCFARPAGHPGPGKKLPPGKKLLCAPDARRSNIATENAKPRDGRNISLSAKGRRVIGLPIRKDDYSYA